jgi:hypothetical protein
MNDLLFAQELAAVLASDDYAGLRDLFRPSPEVAPQIYAAQAAADLTRPTLTISGDFEAYGFARRKGSLAVEIRGRAGDETADDKHQVRFATLYAVLLGELGADAATTLANRNAAKAALKAALAARGKVELADYGCASNAIDATADGDDLRTVLNLRVAWAFLPPV